jgi:transposase-like protein
MPDNVFCSGHSTGHHGVISCCRFWKGALAATRKLSGRRWRMDGTYIEVRSQRNYLYRAVEEAKTDDFLRADRD